MTEVAARLAVELDDQGFDAGVEAETLSAAHLPFDPKHIKVTTEPMVVSNLLRRLEKNRLDLQPDFQRLTGVWDDTRQSRLIESLLLKIPLPTFYMSEGPGDALTVVDGIQRLSTIARFVKPGLTDAEPLRLKGLEYLDFEGRTFDELPDDLQDDILEAKLTVNLIMQGTPEQVMFNIFARINTGGQPLSLQELRHALIPGRTRILLRELADSEAFLTATQHSISPTRMADREMVLRFLAFRLTDPSEYRKGDLDAFLRDATHKLNNVDEPTLERLKEEFHASMALAAAIFNEHAFRKLYRGQTRRQPISKALFEAVSVGLADNLPDRDVLIDQRFEVQERYMDLMEDVDFFQSISVGIGDTGRVQRRFTTLREMFQEVVDEAR
ncbi:DUF262 domain-containing protein [Actinocorallia lasiicapitis]